MDKQFFRLMAHDQQAIRKSGYFFYDDLLPVGRFSDNGVEVGNDGHTQGLQHMKDIRSVLPAEYAKFVLENGNFILIGIEKISGPVVICLNICPDTEFDAVRIVIPFWYIVHGDHDKVRIFFYLQGKCITEVGCIGGNSTPAW